MDQLRAAKIAENVRDFTALAPDNGLGVAMVVGRQAAADFHAFVGSDDHGVTFLEAAFARFKLIKGNGCSIVYSHRIYGEKVGNSMSDWLKANGAATEKALMSWKDIPVPAAASRTADRKPSLALKAKS